LFLNATIDIATIYRMKNGSLKFIKQNRRNEHAQLNIKDGLMRQNYTDFPS